MNIFDFLASLGFWQWAGLFGLAAVILNGVVLIVVVLKANEKF